MSQTAEAQKVENRVSKTFYHCDDWYGNARVFMIGERILALSGSLMKEARITAGLLDEIRALPLE